MKKLLIASVFMISTAFAQYCDYNINFKETKNTFTLEVETAQEQPMMGNLVITDLKFKIIKDQMPGLISMNLELDPDSAHLQAFGLQKGSFKFLKGHHLPQIKDGQYEIVINEVSCGHMVLDQKNGGYYPLERSFR